MRWSLKPGVHDENNEGNLCAMEAVAFIAGESWTYEPACACPVITSIMISWNDSLPTDADRDRLLKPLIPRLVGTKSDSRVEERRAYLQLDWLMRVHAPRFLELSPSLASYAQAMRDLPEITDSAGATAASELARRASQAGADLGDPSRDVEWAAARSIARDATWEAAFDAARAACGDSVAAGTEGIIEASTRAVVWDAAWHAAAAAAWTGSRNTARAAAEDAGSDAAAAAAWDGAEKVLAPTVDWLQLSAVDLLCRMIAVR
jgi:hypothetical protein